MPKNLLCTAVSVLALTAGAVFSADQAHAQAQTAAEAPTQLEDVVVTARRSEEQAQSVPITVTAISAEKLQANVIQSGLDLQKMVPTLSVVQGSQANGASYSLRGIRTGVVTYLNEAPTPSSQAGAAAVNLQLYDLANVQAISGPQGTLFGRNSTGGAILFTPKKPSKVFEGSVAGELGNYNRRQFTGVLNVPVNDMLQVRLGAQITRRDGVVENTLNKDQQDIVRDSYRIGVLFTPTEKITNYTLVDYGKVGGVSYGALTFGCTGFCAAVYPTVGPGLVAQQKAFGIRKVATSFPELQIGQEFGAQNVLTYNITDDIAFKYIASYRTSYGRNLQNKVSFNIPFIYGQDYNKTKEAVQEIQLQGHAFDQRMSWVTGFFWRQVYSSNFNALQLFNPIGTPFSIRGAQSSPARTDNESEAVYAQGTFKVTEQLSLTGGVRRTRDDQATISQSFLPGGRCGLSPTAAHVNLAICEQPQAKTFNATTYLLSADYKINDQVLLYATTRTGYNAGGFNQGLADAGAGVYNPEHLTDYEAGVKADYHLGEVPVRTNLSAFLGKYKDIQRSVTKALPTGVFAGVFNAAEATIEGAQFEFVARPATFLDLNGSVGYLKTKYDKFEATALSSAATGNKFAQAPEWTYNIGATFKHDLSFATFQANITYAHISEVTFTDTNVDAPLSFQKGYGLVDLSADLKNLGGRPITVGVWVKNATDEDYAVNISDQSKSLGFTSYIYGDPRTYGVSLRYEFGS